MKLKDGFITRTVQGTQMMVAVEGSGTNFHGLVRSNETAAFIVDCLKTDTTEERIVDRLLEEYDVALAMVTMGAEGCYLTNGNAAVRVTCPQVRPVDTTGAGDIFGGSAISQLLRLGKEPWEITGQELERVGAFATMAASLSTQRRGGIPSIVPEREVLSALGWA